MPANQLAALVDPQRLGQDCRCLLDLHPNFAVGRKPAGPLDLGDVDACLTVGTALGIAGQGGDEGVDLLRNECSLARPGLHQAAGGQPLDRVADGVPRRVISLPKFKLRRKLCSMRQLPTLNPVL